MKGSPSVGQALSALRDAGVPGVRVYPLMPHADILSEPKQSYEAKEKISVPVRLLLCCPLLDFWPFLPMSAFFAIGRQRRYCLHGVFRGGHDLCHLR